MAARVQPPTDPYAPPGPGYATPPPMPPGLDQVQALERVKAPAVTLLVTSSVGIVMIFIGVVATVFQLTAAASDPSLSPREAGELVGYQSGMAIFRLIPAAVGNGFGIWAAQRMRRLEGHGTAIAASIVAIVPCTSGCCLLSAFAGIWCLVVLLDGQVKAAFQARA